MAMRGLLCLRPCPWKALGTLGLQFVNAHERCKTNHKRERRSKTSPIILYSLVPPLFISKYVKFYMMFAGTRTSRILGLKQSKAESGKWILSYTNCYFNENLIEYITETQYFNGYIHNSIVEQYFKF